jgi:vacuolar-type H+-ATPase subunit H
MKLFGFAFLLAALSCAVFIVTPAIAQEKVEDDQKKEDNDGTYVVGKIEIDEFKVETEYGTLTVPREELIRVKIGKNANKELKEKITSLIEQLGDEEFKAREEASKKLSKLGKVALQELRTAVKSEDIEVRTRAEKLVKEIVSSMGADTEEILDDEKTSRTSSLQSPRVWRNPWLSAGAATAAPTP